MCSTTEMAILQPKIKELTDGNGVNVVFDPVGGILGKQATQCIARHGRFGLIGYASDSWVLLDPLDMCIREYSSIGILSGFLSPQEFAAVGLAVIDLVVAGKIYTPVEKSFLSRTLPLRSRR